MTELERRRFHENFECGVFKELNKAWVRSIRTGQYIVFEFDIGDIRLLEEAVLVAADTITLRALEE
jgi:hypothetical protein